MNAIRILGKHIVWIDYVYLGQTHGVEGLCVQGEGTQVGHMYRIDTVFKMNT